MEGLFLLVGLALLAIPALAIGAWVRTGNLRRLLDDRHLEYERTISDLRGEIATLRRSITSDRQADRQGRCGGRYQGRGDRTRASCRAGESGGIQSPARSNVLRVEAYPAGPRSDACT